MEVQEEYQSVFSRRLCNREWWIICFVTDEAANLVIPAFQDALEAYGPELCYEFRMPMKNSLEPDGFRVLMIHKRMLRKTEVGEHLARVDGDPGNVLEDGSRMIIGGSRDQGMALHAFLEEKERE